MWVSLQAPDLSSLLLRAQDSGAQVLGLANAGTDFIHALKAANESGITKAMKPVGPLARIPNVDSLGLEVAQGLILTTVWYRDRNDETRAFSKRPAERIKKLPSMAQTGTMASMT